MATFAQFYEKHPAYKSWYYICGAERTLVEDVFSLVLEMMEPDPQALSILTVGEHSEGKILAELHQDSPFRDRLIVIRRADKLTVSAWDQIIPYLKDARAAQFRLVCIGEDEKPDTKEARFRPFVERGQFVSCARMDDIERLFRYVTVIMPELPDESANYLVEQFEEDFLGLRNVCKQLKVFDRPTGKLVEVCCADGGERGVVTALFGDGGKREALRVLRSIEGGEATRNVLRAIERELIREIFAVDALRAGMRGHELYTKSGVPKFALPRILARIDKGRVNIPDLVRRLELVARTSVLVERGEEVAVLEWMLARW